MKVIGIYNIKGGVGKTAAAVNLSYLCAKEGARTLVWDLDPQGAASFYFRVKPKLKGGSEALLHAKNRGFRGIKATDFEGLDLLPADFSLRNLDLLLDGETKRKRQLRVLLRPLEAEYDYIFIDCAPSISLVSENVFRAADALLIPMIPTTLSVRTLDQLVGFIDHPKLRRLDILSFFSMVDGRKRLHREIMERLSDRRQGVLRSYIPYSADVEKMGIMRAPLDTYAPRCAAAHSFRLLWQEIRRFLSERRWNMDIIDYLDEIV